MYRRSPKALWTETLRSSETFGPLRRPDSNRRAAASGPSPGRARNSVKQTPLPTRRAKKRCLARLAYGKVIQLPQKKGTNDGGLWQAR